MTTLRECLGCNARYASADEVDLCSDCSADYEGGKMAGKGRVPMPPPSKVMEDSRTKRQRTRGTEDDAALYDYCGTCGGTGRTMGKACVTCGGTGEPADDSEAIYESLGRGLTHGSKNSSDNAHPNGELVDLIKQQREDTSNWQNAENHSPNGNLNPASLEADDDMPGEDRTMETTVVSKVFVTDINNIEGGKVLLAADEYQVIGKVITDAEDGFAVEWRTGRKSIEKKANYDLVVVAEKSDKCEKCQGYGVAAGLEVDRGEVVGDTIPCPVCSGSGKKFEEKS